MTKITFMDFYQWRREHPEIEIAIRAKLKEAYTKCKECGGSGLVSFHCSQCSGEHQKECCDCDGNGEHDNVETAMKQEYQEQLELDRKKVKALSLL